MMFQKFKNTTNSKTHQQTNKQNFFEETESTILKGKTWGESSP